ncbi:DNA-binding transcriptional LysR family regulator [Rhodobium orientis]|uniref:LysR family transcriptional regulator n=1 Tax=Rhodobium orientis TaxID=34017 RepID=A0A327JZS1_9HYPH|nr:LysR family transcriptional regulator [Rhodobium orientis]MBB4302496.1 DNA-binding transcriptional LysR family regulator [Rhodobium orientis]MBK5949345.1 LysR family transcriptional regulator [Rhodobium orientis]RAI28608.1 LysR family transcriptional regulator [Rhodobium orientis]
MDWEDLRHFSAFATHGSLTGAARVLGVEHATVARRIAALEAHLQVRLVDRRGRRLMLTPDGGRVAAFAEAMEGDAAAIERAAAGARAELRGEITISAPPAFAAARLAAPLAALRKQHPGLAIRLIGESRGAALERREADIAIRLSRPEEGDFTIFKLGAMAFRLYASAAYLQETPEPDWTFIGYDGAMAAAPQQVKLRDIARGRPIAFTASTTEIQAAAARAGAGVAMLPDFLAEADAALQCVNPDDPVFRRDIWLVVHSDMRTAPGIRATIDALKAGLAG